MFPLAPSNAASPDPLAGLRIAREPYYRPHADEFEAFAAAREQRLPMLLKGPTGCGKTRFVEHMAWRLQLPLVTVPCHDELSAGDLVGRWLLEGGQARWRDGPLALAARHGGLCYLDEWVEGRVDTTVVIQPLIDTRRVLHLAGCDETVPVHPDFQLLVSCNPAPPAREMKASTRQRFCALAFDYPAPEREADIVAREAGLDLGRAAAIVAFGVRTRRLAGAGLDEGASTRMLVHAALLVSVGMALPAACRMAVVDPLSDDPVLLNVLRAALDASF